jgi:quercetin dioxygenase-like cupin family protein
MAAMELGSAGMHTSDGIDYVVVVSGEVTLDLDGGEQAVQRAGDVLVQNGAWHTWRNDGAEQCAIVGIAIGTDRTRPTVTG